MIDKIIEWLINTVVSKFLPSTIMKSALIVLIVSLFLSLFIGQWIIICTLVVTNVLWLVTEYLYAKGAEKDE